MLDMIDKHEPLPFFMDWLREHTVYELIGETGIAFGFRRPNRHEFWLLERKLRRPPQFVAFGVPLLWRGRRKLIARYSNNFVTLLGEPHTEHTFIENYVHKYNDGLESEHSEAVVHCFRVTVKHDPLSRTRYEAYH